MNNDLFAMMMAMEDTPIIRENASLRAPFSYPGSKADSAEHIHPHLPYRNGYGEPFGGSGIILLQRNQCKIEVFNDRFSGVTSFYRVLRDPKQLAALKERLALTCHSREEFEWCRDTWENVEDDLERAARWWYMHMTSFTKQGRHFARSTKSKNTTGNALRNSLAFFEPTHRRLANVIVENQDWRLLLKDFDCKDMVWYMDPPYVAYSKGKYKHEFTKADHYELCERIFGLQGFVALSGYGDQETKDIYDRYPWDEVHQWEVTGYMQSYAFTETNNMLGNEHLISRDKMTENLWIRYGAAG